MFNPNNFLFRKTMTNVYFKCILQNLSPAFIFFKFFIKIAQGKYFLDRIFRNPEVLKIKLNMIFKKA